MKNLHKINKFLSDDIVAQIWAQREKSLTYRSYKFARIYNKNKVHRDRSPLVCSKTSDFQHPYNWRWEPIRLNQWIEAGKPAIDLSTVEIIDEELPLFL